MSCCLEWSPGRAVIARRRLCWSLGAQLGQSEALEERGQGTPQVQLLVVLRIGAMLGVLRVPVGAGLAWPGWDCRCRQEVQELGMETVWARPVEMVGHCTW